MIFRRGATGGGGRGGNCPPRNMVKKKKKEGKIGKRRERERKRRKGKTYDRMAHPILSWGNKNCVTRSYVLPGIGVNPGGQGLILR